MTAPDRAVLVARRGIDLVALLCAAAATGPRPFVLENDRFLPDHVTPDPVRAPLMPRADAVTHIDTPKPLSKRRARRLRGKARS